MLDESAFCYFHMFGWWLLVQSWETLRFSDHQGIVLSHIELDEQGFTAKLTHSKTLGSDREHVSSTELVYSRERAGWLQAGH